MRGEKLCGFELVVHESLHLCERDVVEIDGIWRTRVARTLVDLGTSVALGHIDGTTVTVAIQDAVRRNLTDLAQLESTFARLAPDIRIGARQFREALDEYQPVLVGRGELSRDQGRPGPRARQDSRSFRSTNSS